MKIRRIWITVLSAALLMTAAACGGGVPEPAEEPAVQDLEVLEETDEPDATEEEEDYPEEEEDFLTDEGEEIPVLEAVIEEDGSYTTKEDVALYLYTYDRLPDNFMTKKEARKKGWEGGALNRTIKGMCIGGDEYSNFEGTLPEADDRIYYECDIGTLHAKKRGAKRIVWSNDGLIYYTNDHYDTFELLYGEE